MRAGAPLPRLAARIIPPMLSGRFPDLRLAVPDEQLRVQAALSEQPQGVPALPRS
ncbi:MULTISPECIES: hypothetical protein [unclassified Nocardiopsis]|uniref:hypothetical protein n=1 Tax=unclassified Nocardiopsis TaxID=2649073 RepID=UPI00135BA928|nr:MULTISPECIES: hypothetical protein [unclassified Nocardiopsis]